MQRLILGTFLVAVIACTSDSGPTTPSVTSAAAAATSVNLDEEMDGQGRPTADDLEARIVITLVHVKFRECEGEDGHYSETRNVFVGGSTGDQRITGDVEIRVKDLFNNTQNTGPQLAHITISDPATGRIKAEGDYTAWGPADLVQGTIVGVVKDEGSGAEPTSGGGKWAANYRLTFHSDGITAQIGGFADDNRLPAGLWRGRCSGKWTEFDVNFGAPTLSASGAHSGQNFRAPRL
jgi:hypothetical protein